MFIGCNLLVVRNIFPQNDGIENSREKKMNKMNNPITRETFIALSNLGNNFKNTK